MTKTKENKNGKTTVDDNSYFVRFETVNDEIRGSKAIGEPAGRGNRHIINREQLDKLDQLKIHYLINTETPHPRRLELRR